MRSSVMARLISPLLLSGLLVACTGEIDAQSAHTGSTSTGTGGGGATPTTSSSSSSTTTTNGQGGTAAVTVGTGATGGTTGAAGGTAGSGGAGSTGTGSAGTSGLGGSAERAERGERVERTARPARGWMREPEPTAPLAVREWTLAQWDAASAVSPRSSPSRARRPISPHFPRRYRASRGSTVGRRHRAHRSGCRTWLPASSGSRWCGATPTSSPIPTSQARSRWGPAPSTCSATTNRTSRHSRTSRRLKPRPPGRTSRQPPPRSASRRCRPSSTSAGAAAIRPILSSGWTSFWQRAPIVASTTSHFTRTPATRTGFSIRT